MSADPTYPLPELLEFFKDMAGPSAALTLSRDFGGTHVYLPKPDNLHAAHPLVKSLGLADAKTLCQEFGPGEVDIPLGAHRGPTKKSLILKEINDETASTRKSNREVAREAGTTERYVRMVRNGGRDPNQLNLLDDP